jgi:hypothetical protein
MTDKKQPQLEHPQSEGGGSFEEVYRPERAKPLAAASAELEPK